MTVVPISSAPSFSRHIIEKEPADMLVLPVASQAVCRLRHAADIQTGPALTPHEALQRVNDNPGVTTILLAGPGDPLATMVPTLETLVLLKTHHPGIPVYLSTSGIGGASAATNLASAGLDGLTLQMETTDLVTAEKLYAWIRPGKKTIPLSEAIPLLLDEQKKTIQAMAAVKIPVTVRTTICPEVNAHLAGPMAATLAQWGVGSMEIVPFVPTPGAKEGPHAPTRTHMHMIGKYVAESLPVTVYQVAGCGCGCTPSEETQCGCGCNSGKSESCGLRPTAPDPMALPKPTPEKPRVAAVSATGMNVDLHLGQARTLLIYGPREDGLTCLLETRQAPEAGSGETRWHELAEILHDCFALLVTSAGQRPREVLASQGIKVLLTEESIDGTVDVLFGGGKKKGCSGR
jgi:nitrogen fixation protein NifB